MLASFLGLNILTVINYGLFPVTPRTFFVGLARVLSQMILVCTLNRDVMFCSPKGKQSGFHSQAILVLERNTMEWHPVNVEETKSIPVFNNTLSSSCVKDFSLMLQM